MVSTHLNNISQIGNLPQLGVTMTYFLKPPPTVVRFFPKQMIASQGFLILYRGSNGHFHIDRTASFLTLPIHSSAKAICSSWKKKHKKWMNFGFTCLGLLPGMLAGEPSPPRWHEEFFIGESQPKPLFCKYVATGILGGGNRCKLHPTNEAMERNIMEIWLWDYFLIFISGLTFRLL